MTAFELAVQDAAGIRVAADLGVDRIELCSALPLGGLTPSVGLITAAVASGVAVHVLVRPRGGDFEYDDDERAVIVDDVRWARAHGAAGVVVGGLRDGRVDEGLIARVTDAADGGAVTFHRAFDNLVDLASGLDRLRGLGVTRVLTSGGAARADEALPVLRQLVAQADHGIEIMAGSGVRSDNVTRIVATGVDAVHASAKHAVAGRPGVSLGSAATDGGGHESVDADEARRLVGILRATKDTR
ncbi:copper homeostasis protein CutC [Microbacterium trichothecenolyticum]|uniref:PF03932 family protein CutC n=1 Tax=Microbacterium trichothecenolyticum TaxID=69370 RepID=A0ABU0TW40_MICTR|nr:copper homeostasis protein CutC [Microbacterium trichothecenolyticum]MDQ1123881.1 copper homeostasis protein [Microbacterium trichothecenolyticum]